MGTWSYGSFDNDDAMDWVAELEGAENTEPLSEAFGSVIEAGAESLEAPDASIGLVAAEVVAALLGKPPARLPDEVAAWVAGRKASTEGLVKKARRVVARVLRDSELKELWAESVDSSAWRKGVESLLQRLGGTPA